MARGDSPFDWIGYQLEDVLGNKVSYIFVLQGLVFASTQTGEEFCHIKANIQKATGGIDIRGRGINFDRFPDLWLETLKDLSGPALKRILLEENVELAFHKSSGYQNGGETSISLTEYLSQMVRYHSNLFVKEAIKRILPIQLQEDVSKLLTFGDILECIPEDEIEKTNSFDTAKSDSTLDNMQVMLVRKHLNKAIRILAEEPLLVKLKSYRLENFSAPISEDDENNVAPSFDKFCKRIEDSYNSYEKYERLKKVCSRHPFFTKTRMRDIWEYGGLDEFIRVFLYQAYSSETPVHSAQFLMKLDEEDLVQFLDTVPFSLIESPGIWFEFAEHVFQKLKAENLEKLKEIISTVMEDKKENGWKLQGNTLKEAIADYIEFRRINYPFLGEASKLEELQTLMCFRQAANQYPNIARGVIKLFSFDDDKLFYRSNSDLTYSIADNEIQRRFRQVLHPTTDIWFQVKMIEVITENYSFMCKFLNECVGEKRFLTNWDLFNQFLQILNNQDLFQFYKQIAQIMGYDIVNRIFPYEIARRPWKMMTWIQEPLVSKFGDNPKEKALFERILKDRPCFIHKILASNEKKTDRGMIGQMALEIIEEDISNADGETFKHFTEDHKSSPTEVNTFLEKYHKNPELLTELLFGEGRNPDIDFYTLGLIIMANKSTVNDQKD